MARINLLPWREELRQEQKKQFITMAVMTALLALAVWGLIHFQMQSKIDYQLSRNNFMNIEIKKLDDEIKEIRGMQDLYNQPVLRDVRSVQDIESLGDIPPLRGIRELYTMLTGDPDVTLGDVSQTVLSDA